MNRALAAISLSSDERHEMIDLIAKIIHDKLRIYLDEANAHDLAETEAAAAIVAALFAKDAS